MTRFRLLCAGLALAALNCANTPTPLAPLVSGSIGVPHHGVQTGAVELPRAGRGFARYRPYSPNYWGQPALVAALTRAAERVDTEFPGGEPMLIGDLSAQHGGKIPNHRSHRTGRDVDLLWYVTTPAGAPSKNPGFVGIAGDGLAQVGKDFVALDVPRQWALVKALLSDRTIGVQWMFASQDVEALLIEYARARGEPDALVWYAETVLHQPRDSAPHDDHIHMRLACSPDELVRGCSGGGPYWEFLARAPRLRLTDEALMEWVSAEPGPEPELGPPAQLESASGAPLSQLEWRPTARGLGALSLWRFE